MIRGEALLRRFTAQMDEGTPAVWRALPLVATIGLLGRTLQLGNGALTDRSLPWFAAALACAFALPAVPSVRGGPVVARTLLAAALLAALAATFVQLVTSWPGVYIRAPLDALFQFFGHLALAAVLAAAAVLAPRKWRLVLGVALVAGWGAAALWLIRHAPNPHIDVRVFQHDGVQALLAGRNPYAITIPNIYGHTLFYAEELVSGGRVQFGYPYPPIPLLLAVGGVAAGDVRYSQLLALVLAALVLIVFVRGRWTVPAVGLVLFTPRAFFVLEQTWTEPFTVLLLACTVATALRRPKWCFLPFGLLLGSKQYLLAVVPLALLVSPGRDLREHLRFLGLAGAIAVVSWIPFLVWDAKAFFHSVIRAHLLQPFRSESLSLSAWLVRQGARPVPSWLGLPLAWAAAALLAVRWKRSPAAFSIGFGLVLMVLFLLSKQAFCNYYYLALAAFGIGLAALQTDVEPAVEPAAGAAA